jgi:acyl carrier protein phosphodiesterase
MNFLAHVYLSGDNDEIRVGNFVADWIKGSDYNDYSPNIRKGIILHRSIDTFTDTHPIVKKSKSRLAGDYGKYAGIIIDIFYDHFLARSWEKYSRTPLNEYSTRLYLVLEQYLEIFPDEIRDFIPRFIRHRWLDTYASTEGIGRVLKGMSRHTSLPDHTDAAIQILLSFYEDFNSEFQEYFPQLIEYVQNQFQVGVK